MTPAPRNRVAPSGLDASTDVPPREITCDVCREAITDGGLGLVRWCGGAVGWGSLHVNRSKSDCAHCLVAHKGRCDRIATVRTCDFASWEELDYFFGDTRSVVNAIPRMLWISQEPGVPADQWRDVFLRLTVQGYAQAKRVLTKAVCDDIGIPTPAQEVARLTPSFCAWVIETYGERQA